MSIHKRRLSGDPRPSSGLVVIGGADGPTAIYVTHKINPAVLAFAAGTVFGIIVSIIAALRHKKHG